MLLKILMQTSQKFLNFDSLQTWAIIHKKIHILNKISPYHVIYAYHIKLELASTFSHVAQISTKIIYEPIDTTKWYMHSQHTLAPPPPNDNEVLYPSQGQKNSMTKHVRTPYPCECSHAHTTSQDVIRLRADFALGPPPIVDPSFTPNPKFKV